MADEGSWRTASFRQNVVVKIDEAIQSSGMPTAKNSMEMENHVFQKAKTKEEYLGFVARLILHVREMRTGNNQMMGMGGPQNSGMAQQPQSQVAAATLLQSGKTRSVMQGNQGLSNLQSVQNKMPELAMGQGSQVGAVGQMQNQMRVPMGGQVPGQMQPQLNVQMQAQMQPQMQGQMQPQMQGQMQGQMQPQMQGQMQPQMQGQMQPQMQGQMQPQMQGQMQPQMQGQMQSQMQGQMQPQMQGQMQPQMQGQMQPQMQGQMQPQMQGQMPSQMSGSITGQLPNQMSGQMPGQVTGQLQHNMAQIQNQRKAASEVHMLPGNPGFGGPRNVAPGQFFRQTPSPSAQSPAGQSLSNQMAASPAMVLSPSPQLTPMSGLQRSVGMAASPSSSLNTPGQAVPTPSPCSLQEDQAYREKVRQLSKYIEPLRRMIAKMGNDDVEKLSKMKKLLDILSNPSKRMPLETLLKCEVVLEKLDFKRSESSVVPQLPSLSTLKEHHIFNSLLEAVSQHMYSPVINHTLHRTFKPSLEALFGPEIRMMPTPLKKKKLEDSLNDIPDVLQGEIARLDQRFKVSLDPMQQVGSKTVQLVCWLDDRHLPCVPPISLYVPDDYPQSPPRCHLAPHEYSATQFLSAVQRALEARIAKLPGRYSVSQLLDTWEMSVRQASVPALTPVSVATVLMGL